MSLTTHFYQGEKKSMKHHHVIAAVLILAAANLPVYAFDLNINKIIGTVKNLRGATTEVDEKQEINIGQGIAANLLGAAKLVDDEHLQKYVNAVGRWLAVQTERPDLPWQFGVLESDNLNAFAAPGGYIFITKGLLQHMKSEAELAGVLAHEISHVLKKHHLAAIQKNAWTGLAGELVNEGLKGRGNTEVLNKAVSFGTEIYARGLDKDDEFEADRMGVVIAARAGYDSYGLATVLQTLQAMSPQDSNLALMFKTHPSPDERLETLEKIMPESMDKYALQPQLSDRFLKIAQSK